MHSRSAHTLYAMKDEYPHIVVLVIVRKEVLRVVRFWGTV